MSSEPIVLPTPEWPRRWAVILLLLLLPIYLIPKREMLTRFLEPNQASRIYLTLAMYHRGEIKVNSELSHYKQDEDLVLINGNYYSNKYPGSSLWLLMFAPIINLFMMMFTSGRMLKYEELEYWGRILALTLPFMAMLYSLGRYLQARVTSAVAWGMVLALALGTNAGIYASFYYGHCLTAVFLWTGFLMADRPGPRRSLVCGSAIGMALLTEPVVIMPAAAITAWLWCRSQNVKSRFVNFSIFIAAALPFLGALLIYNHAVTGSAWVSPYHFDQSWAAMRTSGYGFGVPSLKSLYGVLLSPARGLLYYSAWMLLLPAGCFWLKNIPKSSDRHAAVLFFVILVIYVLQIASFTLWFGGFSFGMRYLTPIFPFCAAAGAILLSNAPQAIRKNLMIIIAALVSLSAVVHLFGLLSAPYYPLNEVYQNTNAVRAAVLPTLRAGHHVGLWSPNHSLNVWQSGAVLGGLMLIPCLWYWFKVHDSACQAFRTTLMLFSVGIIMFFVWLGLGDVPTDSMKELAVKHAQYYLGPTKPR